MRKILGVISVGLLIPAAAIAQIANNTVRIGVLTDMSSSYAPWTGRGSVIATEMAVEDFKQGRSVPFKIEVRSADFQLKPDLAVSLSKKWLDDGVNAIVDVPQGSAALAVNSLLKGSNAAALLSGTAHDDLTTKECSPNTAQWTYDLTSLNRATIGQMVKTGSKTWFFITVDYTSGKKSEEVSRDIVSRSGGKTVGSVKEPIGTTDFSSFLLQAQSSGADAIAFITGGADIIAALKQAQEFGMASSKQKLVLTFPMLQDIKAIGLDIAQRLTFTEAFYWDADEGKRDFAKRFAARNGGNYPSSAQAGAYSTVLHYLKAVEATRSSDGKTVISKMKQLPVNDPLFGPGILREDGRMVHDMYFVEVKKPAESKSTWDLYKVISKIPGDIAFRPPSKECNLVK
ncbi:ABC transporter substrate-binding protein [Paraburkholderia sp. LEh10]|uniref:ABC transporter substrate-binding protein n=1 Tax=Paraburkholderia sp. LEh10 TaxID=2821353 RepID=UPI001AE18606|nr:ABC transporter substrate-binding protein [Paraburkholderia sp. LEh10]MBP0590459.1 ABC transporter substrate-binding protein [Paraburkholderia sp. LEh10]